MNHAIAIEVSLFDNQGRRVARNEVLMRPTDFRGVSYENPDKVSFGPLEGEPFLAHMVLGATEFWSDPLPGKLVEPEPADYAVFPPKILTVKRF